MKALIKTVLFAASCCLAIPFQAGAQSFTGTETPYSSVRGWDVVSLNEQNGSFVGCGAIKFENGRGVMILQETAGSWAISVATNQRGTFGGGILEIDKASIDSQFEFIGGFALRPLSSGELQAIKAGNQLGVSIIGDGQTQWWSLAGSTAAVLKTTECTQRSGQVNSNPSPRPGVGSAMLSPAVPVGESRIGNCQMGFTDIYRCTFEGLPAKTGYASSTRVTDLFNAAPTVDLDAISRTEADVWALLNGTWLFMGRWQADPSQGECLVPAGNQAAEASANLGQDAWQLCLM